MISLTRRALAVPAAVVALVAATLVTGAVAAPAAAEGGGCSPLTQTISGTIQGQDGRYVAALIGVDLYDAAGNAIKGNGCPATSEGYDVLDKVNLELTGKGADSGAGLTKTWTAAVPANAARAYVEAYPLTSEPEGPCCTDHTRYGNALRHDIPITGGVDLKLPLNCGAAHNGVVGTNSSIVGHVTLNGVKKKPSRVHAFARQDTTNASIYGFAIGEIKLDGSFRLDHLAANQEYTLVVTVAGQTHLVVSPTLGACTTLDFAVDLPVEQLVPQPTFYLSNSLEPGPADFTTVYGKPGDTPLIGDWDGNGKDDIGNRSGSLFDVRYGVASTDEATQFVYGRPGDEVYLGDWDGDGVTTPAVRRANAFFIKNDVSGGVADAVIVYGRVGDEVVVGDWDGDGKDTLGVRRGKIYYLKNSIAGGVADKVIDYGRADDEVVVGDWDGDGKDTLAVRRGSTFYLRNDLVSGVAQHQFVYGRAADRVLVGDFDGDGKDTFAVHR